MKEYHLGVNVFHDVGVAIVDQDCKPVRIYEETKFTGRKEEYYLPLATMQQIAADGFTKFKSLTWPFDINFLKKTSNDSNLSKTGAVSYEKINKILHAKYDIENCYSISHHSAHAESVYFASGFNKAIVLVLDGAGDDAAISVFLGNSNKKEKLQLIKCVQPAQFSYGHLYGFVTAFLGYNKGSANTHCGKIMGLSSYGSPVYYDQIKEIFRKPKSNNIFPSNHKDIFKYLDKNFGASFKITNKFEKKQADLASSIQKFLEDDVIYTLKQISSEYPDYNNLCLAGGVAMNSLMNGKIIKSNLFDDLFVQPASSDTGVPYGAAHFGARKNNRSIQSRWIRANWGFTSDDRTRELNELLKLYNFPIKYTRPDSIIDSIVQSLIQDKIVALCRDRQEVGDRALGFRSILSMPYKKNKDGVNDNVKFREAWRPFAPIVLEDCVEKYFLNKRPEPFMTTIYDVSPVHKKGIEGIVHVDNTARVQTVNSKNNPFIYQILKLLQENGYPPVLLNTSFNINGHSMVRTIYDSVITFLATKIDELIVDEYLIKKMNNIKLIKNSVSHLDRMLEPLHRKFNKMNIFLLFHDNSCLDVTLDILKTTSISTRLKIGSLSVSNIKALLINHKQKWNMESEIQKISKRISVCSLDDKYDDYDKNKCINFLITGNRLVSPLKVGHRMDDFELPEKKHTKEIIEISNKLALNKQNTYLVDIQKRPILFEYYEKISPHISI